MNQQIVRPPVHILNMGETGSGKSTFNVTMPKPQLVWFFDPMGKDMPYLKAHPAFPADVVQSVGEVMEWEHGKYRHVQRADGLVQLEYYHSESPYAPDAYSHFLARMAEFHKEYDKWATVTLDDATFMELEARKWHQYSLNPNVKDPRQWYGGSKELLEEMLMMRFSSLPMNLVVNCHIDENANEMWGEIVRNPAVPGKLGKRLGAAFGEHYRSYVMRDTDGKLVRQLQTVSDGQYAAQTQIDAPDPCYPHYESLWANYRG